jgi:hypothetical protein
MAIHSSFVFETQKRNLLEKLLAIVLKNRPKTDPPVMDGWEKFSTISFLTHSLTHSLWDA